MDEIFSLGLLAQMIRISVPYLLAAQGGVVAERAGVVSITLEGFLLMGAFGGMLGAYAAGPLFGLLLGVLLAAAFAGLHALAAVRFRVDAIVSGVALNLMALGLTRFALKLLFDSSSNSPRIQGFNLLSGLSEAASGLPLLGPILAELLDPMVLLALALVFGVHLWLSRTPLGLRLRAVGEHPEAAETAGVAVRPLRALAVVASGALAGLGGVYLALYQHGFTAGMSGNRGYIALAAVILGRWRPLPAALACLFFAFAEAVALNLQAEALLPSQLVQMIPYLLTLVAVAGVVGVSHPPAALGKGSGQ